MEYKLSAAVETLTSYIAWTKKTFTMHINGEQIDTYGFHLKKDDKTRVHLVTYSEDKDMDIEDFLIAFDSFLKSSAPAWGMIYYIQSVLNSLLERGKRSYIEVLHGYYEITGVISDTEIENSHIIIVCRHNVTQRPVDFILDFKTSVTLSARLSNNINRSEPVVIVPASEM